MMEEKTQFEKWFDGCCKWFIILAILYFGGRLILSYGWGI